MRRTPSEEFFAKEIPTGDIENVRTSAIHNYTRMLSVKKNGSGIGVNG